MSEEKKLAEVIAVYPNKVRISVDNLDAFKKSRDEQLEELRVGSYLEISDDKNCKLIAIIESYLIEVNDKGERKFIIEANPLGTIIGDKFTRGGDSLTIPPTSVRPASHADIEKIYETSMEDQEKFCFSKLAQDQRINVPVNGNKFFNKHFAIVGSTGSGKSHTVAKILQEAIDSGTKSGKYEGLNNSHIVLFDIHNEYKKAFSTANHIGIKDLVLPYWLLNSEELEELFLDTGDRNNYNQTSVLRRAITENKKKHNPGLTDISFGTPCKFNINEIAHCLYNIHNETTDYSDDLIVKTTAGDLTCANIDDKYLKFFDKKIDFSATERSKIKSGTYADGTLDKFLDRFENKVYEKRLGFLFGEKAGNISFEDSIKQFIGYNKRKVQTGSNEEIEVDKSNITIIDLGGIPFEVLSITVSLISRILFEYGYFYKKLLDTEQKNCETPLVLIYEEAHKYVPKSDLVRYRSSKMAIERIAKEGRKYGVTLGIISQRPSEISETIFSQCSNFIAMRLTNPDDQNYVKRLLPDTLGNLTDSMPSMQSGEALLIGESIIIPSIVKIDKCDPEPSSNDIEYLKIWKEQWKDVNFANIVNEWKK